MGSIAKALSRANYLKPVADSINQLIQRRQYEQGLQQLASMLSGGEQNIKDIYSGTKEQKTAVPTGRPLSPLSGLTNQSTNVPTQAEDLANTPTLPMEELRIETNHVPKYTPQEQDQLAQGELFNIQKELITNKNIDPAKGGQVISAIQQLINAQQPKKKQLKGINTTDDVYDEYGNLVKRGVPKTTKESIPNRYERVETFDVKGKPVKRGLVKGTNTWEDLGEAYYKPNVTNVNVNNRSYGDKLGELVQTKQEIDNVKKAKWLPKKEVLRLGHEWNGGDLGGAYVYGGRLFYTDDELNKYKEEIKTKGVGNAVTLLNEQGLDNAKEKIDSDVSGGATYKEAYDAFIKNNPGIDKEDKRIIFDYIDLMGK